MKTLSFVLVGALMVSACRGETSRDAPIVAVRNMYDQPRYNMQGASEFFEDGRTMRPEVFGTISREMSVDSEIAQGRLEDGSGYVLRTPRAIVEQFGGNARLLERGQNRYGIYCTPCHDGAGNGEGMVVRRGKPFGMIQPPSFHQKRLREIPDGQLFLTITNGIRNMPPYAPQLSVEDCWAVVGYVRALQLSQASAGPSEEKKP